MMLICVRSYHAEAWTFTDFVNYTGTHPELSCTMLPDAADAIRDVHEFFSISNLIKDNDIARIKKHFSMLSKFAEGGPPDEEHRVVLANYANAGRYGKPIIPVPNGIIGEEIRCNQPTPDIKFVFDEVPFVLKEGEVISYDTRSFHILNKANSVWWTSGLIKFRAARIADRLCVQTELLNKWRNIGCKPAMAPPIIADAIENLEKIKQESGCQIARSCFDTNSRRSMTLIPFTGPIVQCLTESISGFFHGCSDGYASTFHLFQNRMRSTVLLLLVLYVAFFAIKLMLGRELPKKADIFVFIIKFVLVLYFSVGIYSTNGVTQFQSGTTQYLMPALSAASAELAQVMLRAGQANQLCQYVPSDYSRPQDFHNLAIWDSLDCRIGYYLGITSLERVLPTDIAGASATIVGLPISIIGMTVMLTIMPAIMGYQIFLALFTIIFCVGLIAMVISFVSMYVLSILGLNIMVYMAPIFVPLALFQVTKSYFDAWVKQLLAYSLQPMIIAAFLGLIITVFDQTIYTDCNFYKDNLPGSWAHNSLVDRVSFKMINSKAKIFSLDDHPSDECKESPGYILGHLNSTDSFSEFASGLFTSKYLKQKVADRILSSMIYLSILGFMAWQFAELLAGFANDLIGGMGVISKGMFAQDAMIACTNLAKNAKMIWKGTPPPAGPKFRK